MVLPNKYIPIEESYIGVSARILKIIKNKKYSIDKIWNEVNKLYNCNKNNITFKKLTDTITFMYITNMINYDSKGGMIYNANIIAKNN